LFSAISLAAASAADKTDNFGVNLHQPMVLNGTAFKAGDAKVQILDGKAVFTQGKTTASIPVKIETAKDKYSETRIGYKADRQINDIYVGGTNKHILFQETVGGQ
jgi:acetamidase/formamidase